MDKMDVHEDMDVNSFYFLFFFKQQRYICEFYIVLKFQALLDTPV